MASEQDSCALKRFYLQIDDLWKRLAEGLTPNCIGYVHWQDGRQRSVAIFIGISDVSVQLECSPVGQTPTGSGNVHLQVRRQRLLATCNGKLHINELWQR